MSPPISFSEPKHIPLLLSGKKRQTTRLPRKTPLKVGDILYCYYKSRQKKSCDNCIAYSKDDSDCVRETGCSYWHNYFGEAEITKISTLGDIIMENKGDLNPWAENDGFINFKEAQKWFIKHYNDNWFSLPFVVITFKPGWI